MIYKYVYGPVPSRRMGISLGISPIPKGYCSYSCIYCQLGRTKHMTIEKQEFFKVNDIVNELKNYLKEDISFDVITIVGEGEPTLYSKLGELINSIKQLTKKPVALITNGSLLSDYMKNADIILPSFDAFDEESFKKINRPFQKIKFNEMYETLKNFSKNYTGELWIELMLVKGLNDSKEQLLKMKELLKDIKYDKLYINVPVRPPAEEWVKIPDEKNIKMAVELLNGISIDQLISNNFFSEIKDDYEAILSIIKRHPMNQHEILTFLKTRNCKKIDEILSKLFNDEKIESIFYKGYTTFRIK
ncbi:radical SAM protein [Tepiditoga spiralis]|uniref:Radical SAM protein n=1 Tax=Tepiditoga spiralis TaxID=2108365 RepID=A0A7G1GBM9_9BACT|nr:radical SAM protein [Tepiditoga spiralis]BBE31189.1 radical SAM protein [Tepiditoga spiralis]